MLRVIFTLYLILATFAGRQVCCMTARAASLLPTLPVSRPEHHPCCPEEPKDEATPPETPQPCETPTIFFKIERHEVASAYVTMPVPFVADGPLVNEPALWEPNADFSHLYGTNLLHVFQRLTC